MPSRLRASLPASTSSASCGCRLDEQGRVAAPGQSNLAGSALSMDRAIGNMVRFAGVSLDDALAMASTRPAAYLGIPPAGTLDLEWDSDTFTLRVVLL